MTTPTPPRLLAISCTLAATLALAACGSDDNSDGDGRAGGDGSAAAATDSQPAPAKPATDEGQIKALVARVQRGFRTGDGDAICDSLTARGQRDIVDYGQATGLPGSCTEVATAIAKREIARGTEQPPIRVAAVRTRGDSAIALIRIAGATTMRQRYVKVGDDWKVGSFGLSTAAGGAGGGGS
jgi:hypothetical protein